MAKPTGPADRKAFRLEIKDLDERGTFTGYANVFDVTDFHGDIVEKGAFKRTLDHHMANGKKVKLLWQHDVAEPIGVLDDAIEDEHGLKVKGRLVMETNRAREAWALMKAGALDSMSIGYDVVKDEYDRARGVRRLKELRLWEVSLVTFPANEEATVTSVKQAGTDPAKAMDFAEILRRDEAMRNLYERRWKIENALGQAIYQALEDEEMETDAKLALIDSSLGQFHAAYLEWARTALESGLMEKGVLPGEVKAGRRFSSNTKGVLSSVMERIKGAHDDLTALLADGSEEPDPGDADSGKSTHQGPGQKADQGDAYDAAVISLASDIKAQAEAHEMAMGLSDLLADMKTA